MPKSSPASSASQAEELRREQLEQMDFEIGFYDHLLSRTPDALEVLRVQGELLARRGLNARALEIDRRVVVLRPLDTRARYNLACSLALTACPEEALVQLRTAVELGYADVGHLEHDPDLDSLRDRPGYAEIIAQIGRNRV